jgi:hypothetical protein
MIYGAKFIVYGVCLRVQGVSGVFQRAAQTGNPPAIWPEMKVSLKGCVSRICTDAGVDLRSLTVQTRESSKAVRRRGKGGRTGRRKPSGISPGAKVSSKERLSSNLYLSTRDRTSLLLEESSQSLGSSIPLPGIANTRAHTLLRVYTCTRPMLRSLGWS